MSKNSENGSPNGIENNNRNETITNQNTSLQLEIQEKLAYLRTYLK
jgi:hypothetical protein